MTHSHRRLALCVLGLVSIDCVGAFDPESHGATDGGQTPPAADGMTPGPMGDAMGPADATTPTEDGKVATDASDAMSPPDAATDGSCHGKSNGRLKVFILAGQSNMVGQGTVTPNESQITKNSGMGTLEYLVKNGQTASKFSHLVEPNGAWVKRDDVWIVDLAKSGPLTVGYGADAAHIGPELQFGHVIGDFFEDPVLIIKTSWGGKSLYVDFRPPSSGGTVGPYYTLMVQRVHEVLANLETEMPSYKGGGYEIAGFGWHQGWNDRINDAAVAEYQVNCVNLINDLRKELCSGGACMLNMPFALATTGMSGWSETFPRALALMDAQLAVPNDPGLVGGRASAVETRGYYRPPEQSPADQSYHWNRNAETYLLIGDGLGQAIQGLVESSCDPKE